MSEHNCHNISCLVDSSHGCHSMQCTFDEEHKQVRANPPSVAAEMEREECACAYTALRQQARLRALCLQIAAAADYADENYQRVPVGLIDELDAALKTGEQG